MTAATRTARCAYFGRCGTEVPIGGEHPLAFFEDRSAVVKCAHCGYAEVAHERFHGRRTDTVNAGRWPAGLTPHEYEEVVVTEPHDRMYCGCRGWD